MRIVLIILAALVSMGVGAQEVVQHVATTTNIQGHITTLDHPGLNNRPDAIVIVSQQYGKYNPNETGVWYSNGKWKIFNQNRKPIPASTIFNVLVIDPAKFSNAFVHTTNSENTRGHISKLSNPLTDTKSNALVFVTQRFGKYNTSPVGVWFSGGKWNLYNDVEATGVSGRPVVLNTKKFMASAPDQNMIQIRFPYAIRLTETFRYRITEWAKDGRRKTSDWITAESWVTSLDITTPAQQQSFEARLVEMEVGDLADAEVDEVTIQLLHMFDGQERSTELRFHRTESTPVRMANLRIDKGSQILYKVFCRKGNDVMRDEEWREFNPPDGYLFLEIPDWPQK